jgi:hypothetical protein
MHPNLIILRSLKIRSVHDYWIQPEAFSKAITKHCRRERINQKHDLRDKHKTVKHHKTTIFGTRTCRSERRETEIKSMEENKIDLTQII